MVNLNRIVRRIRVIDGVDILASPLLVGVDVDNIFDIKLIVVCVGVNSVTYDVQILYTIGATSSALEYNIHSNLTSDGTDIDDEFILNIGVGGPMVISDTHRRDSTNGKVVTNTVVATLEA